MAQWLLSYSLDQRNGHMNGWMDGNKSIVPLFGNGGDKKGTYIIIWNHSLDCNRMKIVYNIFSCSVHPHPAITVLYSITGDCDEFFLLMTPKIMTIGTNVEFLYYLNRLQVKGSMLFDMKSSHFHQIFHLGHIQRGCCIVLLHQMTVNKLDLTR